MKVKASEQILRLRICVEDPPAGKWFAVQYGMEDLLEPVASDPRAMRFDFAVRVALSASGSPNFLGEFTHGPAPERFMYINSGSKPHTAGAPWERRAKLKFCHIPEEFLTRALSTGGLRLQASFKGKAKDGDAVCASLPAASIQWHIVLQDVA